MLLYRTLFNCTSPIQQALQLFFVILDLVPVFYIQMKLTCWWCIFRFIFEFALPRLFLKLWLSLLFNMQNNKNNYEGAEREERKKKKKKKSYSIAKRNLVRSHYKKVYHSDPPLHRHPQTSNFGLRYPHSCTSLTDIRLWLSYCLKRLVSIRVYPLNNKFRIQ